MENLFGKTLSEIENLAKDSGWPRFTAGQITGWVYQKGVHDFIKMTNLSNAVRKTLSEAFTCHPEKPEASVTAADGTRKYLFRFFDRLIETAVIPDGDRQTLCLSTQSGCRMGCRFCATGCQGFGGSLSPGEMLSQLTGIEEAGSITNLVVMGMGEPLDNLDNLLNTIEILTSSWGFGMSPGRITVSTVGIPENLKILLAETRVNIALSLHDPFPGEREKIMPVERRWPLAETLEILRTDPLSRERKITVEYILLAGINDSPRHAAELNRCLNGIKTKVNLIPCNPSPDIPFTRPDDKSVEIFQALLKNKGLIATIRRSRGGDINAACGLLSTARMKQEQ